MLALSITAARANAVMMLQSHRVSCACAQMGALLQTQILNAELLSDVFCTSLQQRSLQKEQGLGASAIFV